MKQIVIMIFFIFSVLLKMTTKPCLNMNMVIIKSIMFLVYSFIFLFSNVDYRNLAIRGGVHIIWGDQRDALVIQDVTPKVSRCDFNCQCKLHTYVCEVEIFIMVSMVHFLPCYPVNKQPSSHC